MTHHIHTHAVLSAAPDLDRLDHDALVAAVEPMWIEAFPWEGGELSNEGVQSGRIFDNVREHRAHQQAIAAVLARSPRGSWASNIQRLPTGDIFTDILIADGRGGYLLTSKHRAMSVEEARDRLVYKEISDALQSYRRALRPTSHRCS
ncbi:hypothetical protein ACQHIH_21910 (plasmid) [Xanthomonas sontii]|uniref:hypothetical protein n=1 Tax=Xanthomonas sontii TaxID=2650745 RepID=UPI003F855ED6